MMLYSINIHLLYFVFAISWLQPAVTVCCRCYKRSKKASKKALSRPKAHLECFLRPIQATQVTPGQFGTRQKRLEVVWTSNKNLAT